MPDRTSASIDIAATPEEVLEVIADVARYPEWVDSMQSAEVLTQTGGHPDRVEVVLAHALLKDRCVLAYDWQPGKVSWHLLQSTVLTTMDGSYDLHRTGLGTTVTYALAVDADLPMIGLLRRTAEKTIIDGALRGLKRRVEG